MVEDNKVEDNSLEVKKKANLMKSFGKIFPALPKGFEDTTIELSDRKIYMDSTNVCGIVPKKVKIREMITEMFDVYEGKYPELKYYCKDGESPTSSFNSQYLHILLELCKNYPKVQLSVRKDYPLKAETEDFEFILAPRIGDL